MNRAEMRRRYEAAIAILLDNGWCERDLERAYDGLMLDDATERAERDAKAALGLEAA